MKHLYHARRGHKRQRAMVSPGTKTLEAEVSRIRRREQSDAFVGLSVFLDYAVAVLWQQPEEVTVENCEDLGAVFEEVLTVVQGCLAVIESPDMAGAIRPYRLLLKLWTFHRTLIEAFVALEDVQGLSVSGRLATDATGSYAALRQYLCFVIHSRADIVIMLSAMEPAPPSVSVQTDTIIPTPMYAAVSA